MEVPGGLQNKKYVCLNEFIGTAFLLIAINWGQPANLASQVSITLTIFIIIAGSVGGCNLNPAVSIGILIKEREEKSKKVAFFFMIVSAQILGAIAGVCISTAGLQTSMTPPFKRAAILLP